MDEPIPPVILTLYPDPDEPALREFFSTLGMCITSWAFVDRRLYEIFRCAFGGTEHQSGLLYYRLRGFRQKLGLVNDTLRTNLPPETFKKHWQPHHERAIQLSHTRNVLAHQPVRRVGTSHNRKPVYTYTIRIEPYERILNRDYPGLLGKDELSVEDLKQHDQEIEKLERDLRWVIEAILGPKRP